MAFGQKMSLHVPQIKGPPLQAGGQVAMDMSQHGQSMVIMWISKMVGL